MSDHKARPPLAGSPAAELTKKYTALSNAGYSLVVAGMRSVVLASKTFIETKDGLKPTRDATTAFGKVHTLGDYALDQLARLSSCTMLRGRAGLFEIRCNGIRFYGARVGTWDGRDLVLMLDGEQKAGARAADSAVLDRCEQQKARAIEILADSSPKGHKR